MSVFNVFLSSSDKSFDSQFRATGTAAGSFNKYRTDGNPKKTIDDFITGLINAEHLCVTYKDSSQEVVPSGGKLYYYPGGDTTMPKVEIKTDALQDKSIQDKVHMVVPSDPVDITSNYLVEAIRDGFLDSQGVGYTKDQKTAFLMGMLLLKRCR